jgi:hypothetical protein
MLQTARIAASLLFVSVLIAGCNQNDVGRYCFVGAEGGANSNVDALTILNTEAPECGQRLCLKQGGYRCTNQDLPCVADTNENPKIKINPMCTKECGKNKDCEKSDENVNGCRKYVCQEQGAETGFGDHCICVCLDFIRDEGSGNPITEQEFNEESDYNACQ